MHRRPQLRLIRGGVGDLEQEVVDVGLLWSDVTLGVLDVDSLLHGCDAVAMFEGVLQEMRPKVVFDLRPCPLFGLDQCFQRREAFALFREVGATYCDVAGELDVWSSGRPEMRPGAVVEHLSEVLEEHPAWAERVLVLVDQDQDARVVTEVFSAALRPCPAGGWRVRWSR